MSNPNEVSFEFKHFNSMNFFEENTSGFDFRLSRFHVQPNTRKKTMRMYEIAIFEENRHTDAKNAMQDIHFFVDPESPPDICFGAGANKQGNGLIPTLGLQTPCLSLWHSDLVFNSLWPSDT